MIVAELSTKLPLSNDQSFQQRILYEQVKFSYASLASSIPLIAVAVCALAYLLWDIKPHEVLLSWAVFAVVVSLYRLGLLIGFRHVEPTEEAIRKWHYLFVSGLWLHGFVWSAVGVWLLPQDLLHVCFAAIVITGVIAGSLTTLSSLKWAVYTFVLLASGPLIINLLYHPMGELNNLGLLMITYIVVVVIFGASNYKMHLHNITLKLTSMDKEAALLKSEQTLLKTSEILSMIAKGLAAKEIFDAIVLLYESRHPGLRCSMLYLQGNKLIHAGAPSLPKEYCDAMNGLEYGADVCSCGRSTYTGEQVLVEDIATDPKWANLKQYALPHGLRCCWSQPIKDSEGTVLGAFGMYYNSPRLPDANEIVDLEAGAKLAGIVMERERRDNLLHLHSNSLAQAGEAIIITNARGIVEYANAASAVLTGYSEEELLDKSLNILNSGKQSKAYYENMWATISSGQIWAQKTVEKKKDGSLFTARMTVAPVKNKGNSITHYVAFYADLSEIEALENQFFQAQKLESIGALVGGIAHDFNNMLSAIKGNLYLAKTHVNSPDMLLIKLSAIDDLTGRAADMTQQLLTFARRDLVEMKPLSLNQLVSDTMKLVSMNIPENIERSCVIDEQPLVILGDKTQLQQVMMNLLNNARDALKGAVSPKLLCSLNKVDVDADFIEKHPDVSGTTFGVLEVKDTGTGITAESLAQIFEPFFTTKEVGEGTGLGLAMVYGAVKRHGGVIEVNSVVGEGTSFRIFLPISERKELDVQSPSIVFGDGETILLVDDDDAMRESTKEVLESLRFNVLEAENGEVALSMVVEHAANIALIFSDIVMPKLGGLEFAQALRELGHTMPIILATGYDQQSVAKLESDIKNSVIINKPFKFGALSKLINEMVAGAKR